MNLRDEGNNKLTFSKEIYCDLFRTVGVTSALIFCTLPANGHLVIDIDLDVLINWFGLRI